VWLRSFQSKFREFERVQTDTGETASCVKVLETGCWQLHGKNQTCTIKLKDWFKHILNFIEGDES
jgi:hypothetical protein